MEMTPRERWMALFEGRKPDRIPTDYWATGEVTARLLKDLNCPDEESLWKKLHIDRPCGIWPFHKTNKHPVIPNADAWGIRQERINYGTGEYAETVFNPLAGAQSVKDIHDFAWPSPDDFNFDYVQSTLARNNGYRVVSACGYEPFLQYCRMRGLERAFEDMLLEPEILEAGLGHIFDVHFEVNRRTWELCGGKADYFYLAEDLGSQSSPLMSMDTYRKFILPGQKKMADLARTFGIRVFYHTDGAARVFLPDLIDTVGIDVLNPIQWRCPTMEREGLVRDFGAKVIFHGAIDNQQTLPFGTVQDVQDEIRDCVRIFKPARWICAPCHNLQPVTPTANIVAMYETIRELGKLS